MDHNPVPKMFLFLCFVALLVPALANNPHRNRLLKPKQDDSQSAETVESAPPPSNQHHHPIPPALDLRTFQLSNPYVFAAVAGFLAALTASAIAICVSYCILKRKLKETQEVDYPAYGVTGPKVMSTDDLRLAKSAEMYHYHHQKEQIKALEKRLRSGSGGGGGVMQNEGFAESDDEDENDYTVYECPGLASTAGGEMEVQNPIFDEAKCETKSAEIEK